MSGSQVVLGGRTYTGDAEWSGDDALAVEESFDFPRADLSSVEYLPTRLTTWRDPAAALALANSTENATAAIAQNPSGAARSVMAVDRLAKSDPLRLPGMRAVPPVEEPVARPTKVIAEVIEGDAPGRYVLRFEIPDGQHLNAHEPGGDFHGARVDGDPRLLHEHELVVVGPGLVVLFAVAAHFVRLFCEAVFCEAVLAEAVLAARAHSCRNRS